MTQRIPLLYYTIKYKTFNVEATINKSDKVTKAKVILYIKD